MNDTARNALENCKSQLPRNGQISRSDLEALVRFELGQIDGCPHTDQLKPCSRALAKWYRANGGMVRDSLVVRT